MKQPGNLNPVRRLQAGAGLLSVHVQAHHVIDMLRAEKSLFRAALQLNAFLVTDQACKQRIRIGYRFQLLHLLCLREEGIVLRFYPADLPVL